MQKTMTIFFGILLAFQPFKNLYAASLVIHNSGTNYTISVFKSDMTAIYNRHTLILDSVAGNMATFIFDGSPCTITCNSAWHNLNAAPGNEIQNIISCSFENELNIAENSKINTSVILYDQNLYNNIYTAAPEYGDTSLINTNEVSPYCLTDNYYTATACKWELQNLNNPLLDERGVPEGSWVVYTKTDVVNLPFTTASNPTYPYTAGDTICSADLDNDGNIEISETEYCINGEQPLCPFSLSDCSYDGTNYICPHGPEYACINNGTGIYQCSPHDCYSFTPGHYQDEDTTEGETDKTNNGNVDAEGNCLGILYVFSGNDKRCRVPGVETVYHDCCKDQYNMYLIDEGICNGNEVQLTRMRENELCHYVGGYCSKRIPLVGCVQRKKTYCCFHSKLGRIINEQGRTQLQAFGADGGWGSPKNPNCRGFTTDEFQMIDFKLIDLSDWYSDIETTPTEEIQNVMQQKIQNHF